MENQKKILADDHSHFIEQADVLQKILVQLRFEGKACLQKNIKEACEVVDFFDRELLLHLEIEEQVVFPFVETHVPKLESMVGILRSEYENFRRGLQEFKTHLWQLSENLTEEENKKICANAREKGAYVLYLLRDRMIPKCDAVYLILDQELHRDEKKELVRRIQDWRTMFRK